MNDTKKSKVMCDGGPTNGHPLIYLDVSSEGQVTCPYCSKVLSDAEQETGK